MTTQTSYPVFESGQVLTSTHLNDLVDYLEQQARSTRSKLVGIGVVCGLEPCWEADGSGLRLTGGVAVTSEGFLIQLAETLLDQAVAYSLPIPSLTEATPAAVAAAHYPYFFPGGSAAAQIDLWELLPVGHTPAPGQPTPTPLDSTFLNGKVVMLFLECNLESLKNCDINDCSDKGSEMEFTLRTLLVKAADANAMLAQEQTLTAAPVHRADHGRYGLQPLRIAKINPCGEGVVDYTGLVRRVLKIAADLQPDLATQLPKAHQAFEHFLADLYPASTFATGPFGAAGYFDNVFANLNENPLLVQYFYDYLRDLVRSHNEFVDEACRLDAECCPHADRFPKHVLLGHVQNCPTAFEYDSAVAVGSFDPTTANTGFGPEEKVAPRRHHFVPSPLYDRGAEALQRVRSLHYRTYLLAYRYDTDGRLDADIRITPSRQRGALLSDRALPFYYSFKSGDDLHRNWSFDKTVKNRLAEVHSWQLISESDHPYRWRIDAEDFHRVEGVVGKPLGHALQELTRQKRELGLSFGVEPVYLPVDETRDGASALSNSRSSLLQLLLCRMRDLDVIFLVMMAALFYFLFYVIRQALGLNTRVLASLGTAEASETIGLRSRAAGRIKLENQLGAKVLEEIRPVAYARGSITTEFTEEEDPAKSVGALYLAAKGREGNLFDGTREVVRELQLSRDPEEAMKAVYPTVSLLDKTEALVETVSAPSVATFEFSKFEQQYSDWSVAYSEYVAQVQVQRPNTPNEVIEVQQNLQTGYASVGGSGMQALVTSLMTEIQSRAQRMFGDLAMAGYSKRHPGMRHEAGVEEGGSLILLYAHRDLLRELVPASLTSLVKEFGTVQSRYRVGRVPGVQDPSRRIAGRTTGESLDDFVVLGDFCVPYLCCDTDCSDIEIESEDPPAVRTGAVTGRVVTVPPNSLSARMETVTTASVTVRDRSGNAVTVTSARGRFEFEAPAGTYTVAAEARGFQPGSSTVAVVAGETTRHEMLLQRR